MTLISNDLLDAYEGFYETELDKLLASYDDISESDETAFRRGWVTSKIKSHTPKERLEIYCHWNGIIGYSDRLYEIANGEV